MRYPVSFVVKKQFADDGAEALAFIHAKDEDTLETMHEAIKNTVMSCRSEKLDRSSDSMDILNRRPASWGNLPCGLLRYWTGTAGARTP